MVFISSTSSLSAAFVFLFSTLIPYFILISCSSTALLASTAHAATKDEWRSRSIYQIITDRFALSDGSTSKPCDPLDRLFCGGSFQGIIKQLDYIQGMGFTAVSV